MLYSMNWVAMRRIFREQRQARVGSRANLLEKVGDDEINESTVYRFEKEADYFPRLDTFTRLVEAMGLSLTDFFAQLDGATTPPRKAEAPEDRFVAAIDRLIATRTDATTPPEAPSEGTTLTVTLPTPLDSTLVPLVERFAARFAARLARKGDPEQSESKTPRPQVPTEKRRQRA